MRSVLFMVSLCAFAGSLAAQTLDVRTEYWEPGRGSREILSPAVGRNGYVSLQAIVTVPEGQAYSLYVAQNPVESFAPSIYRVTGPRLEPATLPVESAGGAPAIFWLDLWIPPNTPVRRVRVEVQLNVGDRWIIYPMEFRVSEAVFPEPAGPWCASAGPAPAPATRAAMIARNRAQDAALARTLGGFDALRAEVCALAPDAEPYLSIRSRLLRQD